MHVVDNGEPDLAVILFESGGLRQVNLIGRRSGAFPVDRIVVVVVVLHRRHHHPVAVARAGLKPANRHLVDLADRLQPVAAHVVVLRSVLVVEILLVVRSDLHPPHGIYIRHPHHREAVRGNTLKVRPAHDPGNGRSVLRLRQKRQHRQNRNQKELFHILEYHCLSSVRQRPGQRSPANRPSVSLNTNLLRFAEKAKSLARIIQSAMDEST